MRPMCAGLLRESGIMLIFAEIIDCSVYETFVDSRYQLAKLVNKKAITLYYNIGEYISCRSRKGHWGSVAIKTLSTLLRQELPGLRGFSETSIKDMRIFFEEWRTVFENRQSVTADFGSSSSPVGEIVLNQQLTAPDLTAEQLEMFFNVSFTHHREILRKTSTLNERLLLSHQSFQNNILTHCRIRMTWQSCFRTDRCRKYAWRMQLKRVTASATSKNPGPDFCGSRGLCLFLRKLYTLNGL